MKAKEWARVAGPLQALLSDFRPVKFGFVSEGQWVARCVRFDSSRWSADRFYVNAFALPLFVPSRSVYLTYGGRVGPGYWETVDQELVSAVEQELPNLNRLATLEGLVERARNWRIDPHHLEVRLSVAAIWRNEEMVEESVAVLEHDEPPEYDWVQEVQDRCNALVKMIQSEGFGVAEELLANRRLAVLALLD